MSGEASVARLGGAQWALVLEALEARAEALRHRSGCVWGELRADLVARAAEVDELRGVLEAQVSR